MSVRILIFLFPLIFGTQVLGQKMLLLENKKNLKNFKFFEGDQVRYRLKDNKTWFSGDISQMNDTMVVFNWVDEVPLSNITAIARRQWFFSILSRLSMTAGVLYFSIDTFNNLINGNNPLIDQQTAIISAGLVAGGFLLQPLTIRKIKLNENWTLKVLDLGNP